MSDGPVSTVSIRASDALSALHDELLAFAASRTTSRQSSSHAGTEIVVARDATVAELLEARPRRSAGGDRFAVASLKRTSASWHVETEDGAAWAGQAWLTRRAGTVRADRWLGRAVSPVVSVVADSLPGLRFVAQPHHLAKLVELASSESTVDGLWVLVTWEMQPAPLDIEATDFVVWLEQVSDFLGGTDRSVDVTSWDEMAFRLRRRDGSIEVRRELEGHLLFTGSLGGSQARRDVLHAIGEVRAVIDRLDAGLRSTRSLAWMFDPGLERALGE